MTDYTYTEILTALVAELQAQATHIGIKAANVFENPDGVNLNAAPPFLSVSATPKETTESGAGDYPVITMLSIDIYCAVASAKTEADATRAAMDLAGRVLTALDAKTNATLCGCALTPASTPIDWEGTYLNKAIAVCHFEAVYCPFGDLL